MDILKALQSKVASGSTLTILKLIYLISFFILVEFYLFPIHSKRIGFPILEWQLASWSKVLVLVIDV